MEKNRGDGKNTVDYTGVYNSTRTRENNSVSSSNQYESRKAYKHTEIK
jgi:hypothetical protein